MKVFKAVLLLVPLLLLFSLAHAVQKGGELDGTGTMTRMWDGSTDSNTSWIGTGGYVNVVGGELIMDFDAGTGYQYKYPIYNATSTNNISITIIGKLMSVGSTTELIDVTDSALQKGCHLRCTGSTTCYLRAENATKASNAANFAIEPDTYLNWTVERSQNATAMKCVLYRNGVLNQTVQDIKADATPYTIFYSMTTGTGSELRATEIWGELASGLTTTISSPTNTTYSSNNVELEYTADSDAPINYDCAVTIDGSLNTTYVVVDEVPEELTMTGLAQGAHNVNVNCFDGVTNATDTEWFTVDTVLELSLSSPANTTYTDSGMTVTYLPNTTAVVSEISCTVYFDGIANDTYTDLNNTQRTFDFTQLTEGDHNVTVNCGDGTENVTRAVHYTTSFELQLSITSPTNSTYMDSDLTLTYLPNTTYTPDSSINCSVYFDGTINTTYVDVNNTARSINFRELNATFHNVAVNCGDGNENTTRTAYYTMDDVNFTLTASQNATAFEGVTNFYNVTIGINPDIVNDVNASLYWNDTQLGYAYKGKRDLLTYWFNQTFSLPIITTNNTSINTKWNVTKGYVNTSTYVENSSNTAQACIHAWDWDAITYSYNLLEGSLNDISVNLTKLGGVSDPINTSISALLVWNGSPSTMTATMNTSTLLGYSNTTRVPRISAGYNWTFGFNVTLNYSINHGITGYNSRIDTNTTYNYTQTVHTLMFTNCTTGIEALKLRFFDEISPDNAVNSSVDAYLEILLDDGTNRTHGFEFTNNETFRLCIEPYFGSFRANSEFTYGGASIDANYTYREYYLVNASMNNVSNNIDLHTLATANGPALTFTVTDEFGSEIEGVVVKALRWYPLLTGYKTVNMGKTNFDGDAVLNLKFYDTYYKFLFEQNGTVVKEISKLIIYSTSLAVSIAEVLDTYYTILDGVAYNYSSTNVSDVITWGITVSDTSGLMSSINLKCVKKSLLGDTVINDTTITGSAVTAYCVLGNYSNQVFYITATGTFSDYGTLTIYTTTFDWREPYAYGVSGLFASFLIIGSLMFIGLWNPGASIILGIIGIVLTNALGFLDLAISNVIGLIIVGVLIILMRRRNS